MLDILFFLYSKRFSSRFHDFFKYSRCMHDKSRNREMKSKLDSPTRCSAISFNFLLLLSIQILPFVLSAKASTVRSRFFLLFSSIHENVSSLFALHWDGMNMEWQSSTRRQKKSFSHTLDLARLCLLVPDENIICRVAQICCRLPSCWLTFYAGRNLEEIAYEGSFVTLMFQQFCDTKLPDVWCFRPDTCSSCTYVYRIASHLPRNSGWDCLAS